ncbi:MAG: hypothetical protein K2Q22_05270, partial [Cytophagales bacterium]|nr:hypothetical protein [Cytophagales bacterium]
VDFQRLTSVVVQGSYQSQVRERVKNDLAAIDQKQRFIRRGLEGLMALLFIGSILWVYFSNVKSEKLESPKLPLKEGEIKVNPTPDAQVSAPISQADQPQRVVSDKNSVIEPLPDKISTPLTVDKVGTSPQIAKDSLPSLPKSRFETTPAEEAPKEKAAFDCAKIRLSAIPKITAACENESSGIVNFEQGTIQGGKSPYLVTLLKNGKEVVNTQFYALASSNYTFLITDDHRCATELTVYVPSKKCGVNKFVFNPSAGESLQIPLKENRPYLFTLRNRVGSIVYTHHYAASSHFEWEGISLPEQHQGSDLYIYAIEYDNGQQENGQITILK